MEKSLLEFLEKEKRLVNEIKYIEQHIENYKEAIRQEEEAGFHFAHYKELLFHEQKIYDASKKELAEIRNGIKDYFSMIINATKF